MAEPVTGIAAAGASIAAVGFVTNLGQRAYGSECLAAADVPAQKRCAANTLQTSWQRLTEYLVVGTNSLKSTYMSFRLMNVPS